MLAAARIFDKPPIISTGNDITGTRHVVVVPGGEQIDGTWNINMSLKSATQDWFNPNFRENGSDLKHFLRFSLGKGLKG